MTTAPSPKPKRRLRTGYMEKLHVALALLVAKSNDLDVDDESVHWARLRLAQYLEEVDALFADGIREDLEQPDPAQQELFEASRG